MDFGGDGGGNGGSDFPIVGLLVVEYNWFYYHRLMFWNYVYICVCLFISSWFNIC